MDQTGVQLKEFSVLSADQLLCALRTVSLALQQFLVAQAQANDLSLTELTTLIRAADGGGVVPAEAARACGLRRGSMTSLADRLEQRGLIRRVRHPTDRRLLLLMATAEGHQLLKSTLGPHLDQLNQLVEALEQDHRQALNEFAEALITLLEQHGDVDAF